MKSGTVAAYKRFSAEDAGLRREHLAQLGRRNGLELRIRAVVGILVVAPATEARVVTETSVQQAFVFDLGDAFETQWFPRHVFVRIPSLHATGQALPCGGSFG